MCALLRQNVRGKLADVTEAYQQHAGGMRGRVLRMRVWCGAEALRITSPLYEEVWRKLLRLRLSCRRVELAMGKRGACGRDDK